MISTARKPRRSRLRRLDDFLSAPRGGLIQPPDAFEGQDEAERPESCWQRFSRLLRIALGGLLVVLFVVMLYRSSLSIEELETENWRKVSKLDGLWVQASLMYCFYLGFRKRPLPRAAFWRGLCKTLFLVSMFCACVWLCAAYVYLYTDGGSVSLGITGGFSTACVVFLMASRVNKVY